MNRNLWFAFAALCVLGLVALFVFKPAGVPFTGDPTQVVADDHVYGNKDSKVVLIEYADFQCPGCGAAFPIVKEIKEKYKDQIAYVYRYMPLVSIHPNAIAAAAGAEAAGLQGKFWEMHDLLYANQTSWSSASSSTRNSFYEQFAEQLGLNMTTYKSDVASSKVLDRISRDQSAAKKAGLQPSTPTFVLNGTKVTLTDLQDSNTYTVDKFSSLLDKELKKFNIAPPATAEKAADATTN